MEHLTLVDKMKIDFLASCKSLNMTVINDAQAEWIFDGLEYKVDHIFFVDEDTIHKILCSRECKTAENAVSAIKEATATKNLTDIIASLNINECDVKTAEQCGRYIISQELADFRGLSNVGYEWIIDALLPFSCDNESHKMFDRLKSVLRHKDSSIEGHEFDKYVNDYQIKTDCVKVIFSGSPSKYKNKKEFMSKNPEYIETTKWNECQILFTGDVNNTSLKMEKANKLGIKIIEY